MENIKLISNRLYEDIYENYQLKGGVYFIKWIVDKRPVPIPRIFGTDSSGLVYIGKADSFVDRVIALKKTLLPSYRSEGHIAGRRFNGMEKWRTNVSIDDLFVALLPADEPSFLERKELTLYKNNYGEVPPLNVIG